MKPSFGSGRHSGSVIHASAQESEWQEEQMPLSPRCWVQVQTQRYSSCVALRKTLFLSELWLSHNRDSNVIGHRKVLYMLRNRNVCKIIMRAAHL